MNSVVRPKLVRLAEVGEGNAVFESYTCEGVCRGYLERQKALALESTSMGSGEKERWIETARKKHGSCTWPVYLVSPAVS